MSTRPPPGFSGTERFAVKRRLGEGGMGVVYEAHDRERDAVVALKMLSRFDASSIYRLKREFRALSDLSHPNLVAYHELVFTGGHWFFTMEIVDGTDFMTHVSAESAPQPLTASSRIQMLPDFSASPGRISPSRFMPMDRVSGSGVTVAAPTPAVTLDATQLAISAPSADPLSGEPSTPGALPFDPARTLTWWSASPDAKRPRPWADPERLRAALRQLVEGISALHAAGTLHRDVKPSNVMVTRTGRVVLLDFGLAGEHAAKLDAEEARYLVGTPAYIAPEQVIGEPASAASDWYGVGVMLYEAIVGVLPFDGAPMEVMLAKQVIEPPRTSTLVGGVDPDLDELCAALLVRDPAARPSGPEILARLGGSASRARVQAGRAMPFIGREEHMAELRRAFAACREGAGDRAVTVFLHGVSGMGKSALVRRFLEEVVRDHDALVLRGRCYERESVPYKALDSLVDALSRHLMRLPAAEVQALLPDDVRALARLFPVLLEVAPIAAAPKRADVPDVQELRRRGSAALRELFARLGRRRPLVLHIDDLQWGDTDGAALLGDLLRPPSPPRVLLVVSFRSEEAASSELLRELLAPGGWFRAQTDARDLEVGRLDPRKGAELAATLIRHRDADTPRLAAEIAREAGGSPFFIAELVRYLDGDAERGADARGPARLPRLDEVIAARVARLPADARRLLETIAVAGRPVEQGAALRAAGAGEAAAQALALLRAEQLVRTRGARPTDAAETYHDRIREAVAGALGAEALGGLHLRLGEALEATGRADPEALAFHFRGAGEAPRAGRYAGLAAEKAAAALAFDRAARLFETALELAAEGDPGRERLERGLADALANAGRSAEAARVYGRAARAAGGATRLELLRLSAEHACRSGHVDEGVAAFREVSAAIGMRMAKSPLEALASLLARRAQVRLRGLRFRERPESEVPPDLLRRLDLCASVSVGLGMVDTIQGADFQARQILLALEAGEPVRVARALAIEACYACTAGESAAPRVQELIRLGEELARRVDSPYALATLDSARAFDHVFVGRWRPGLEHAEKAEALLRARCAGVAHEIATSRIFALWALYHLGDVGEVAQRHRAYVRDAQERGDLYAAATTRALLGHIVHLAADAPELAQRDIDDAMAGWSHGGFHVQHLYELRARALIRIYRGDAEAAYRAVLSRWPEAARSMLMRVVTLRLELFFVRARAALAASLERRNPAPLLASAEKDAREVARGGLVGSPGWSRLLLAAVAHRRGKDADAIALLETAAQSFEKSDMALWGVVARRRQGELIAGERGARMVREADAAMAGRTIRRPDRFVAILAPGFGGAR